MYKINLYSVGKNKEAWLSDALEIYKNRIQPHIKLTYHWVKNNEALVKALEKELCIVCFDPNGTLLTSEKFADTLEKKIEEGGSKLALVIGAAEGLVPSLKKFPLISLSKMIFTHQLTRIVVAEQIYRATQIWKNSPYHFS